MTRGRAWVILLASAALEAVWATALGLSEQFSHLTPTLVFVVALIASTYGLSLAMKRIPVGTAYATWTGLGAALTVTWAMLTGAEEAGALKIVLLALMIAFVAGLKLFEGSEDDAPGSPFVADAPDAGPTPSPAHGG